MAPSEAALSTLVDRSCEKMRVDAELEPVFNPAVHDPVRRKHAHRVLLLGRTLHAACIACHANVGTHRNNVMAHPDLRSP